MGFKELKDKYQLLRGLMDFIPDVIYFKDREGRFIMVNQAHAKGLGVKPEALVGKTDFDLFPNNRASKMAQDDAQVMHTGKPIIDKVERATRPDGIDNYVSTTKIPRYDEKGRVIGLIGITRDITRRMQFERLRKDKLSIEKKLEALEELSAMKSEFISTVSHELRTPLAVIKGLVTVVFNELVGQINHKQKEVLQKTLDNADRLKKIIDDLLDISRIERNTLKLHYSLVDIIDLMKDSEVFFMKLAEEKSVCLRYVYPDEPVNVFIDADRIRQVISNLISNAIKFTMEGGSIKVEVKILEAKVRIGVIDTGIGVSKADLSSIFNKFTQVSKLPGAENKGVGLGLSISKKLIERHKGEIWVESKSGVGSKFYFTLRRFYTLDMLGKSVRNKVSRLMKNGVSMHFVSLLILNCSEFRKRMKIGSQSLFKDLHAILDSVLKNAKYGDTNKQAMSVINSKAGKFSIILPGSSNKQAANISSLLKYKIKQYFSSNKVEDVFITIGSLSYSQKIFSHDDGFSPSRFSIKEIYIGSEMRRFKRMSFKTNIKLLLPAGRVELSESVDVSEGGICLVIKDLLKTDSQLKISFAFPENKEFIITAKVRVAWIRKIELLFGEISDKYKVGLEFVNLENKFKKVICRRLRSKL